MSRRTETREIVTAMTLDLARINRESGNAAALVLCDLQTDLYSIVDSLVWGG